MKNNISDKHSSFLLHTRNNGDMKTHQLQKSCFSPQSETGYIINRHCGQMRHEMQYEILPLLDNLFPNIQLIIATHSPAIILSLKNAIVHDLTSKNEVSNWITSSSFSELMITHFGLDNEFSPVADKIIEAFGEAYSEKNDEKMIDLMESKGGMKSEESPKSPKISGSKPPLSEP